MTIRFKNTSSSTTVVSDSLEKVVTVDNYYFTGFATDWANSVIGDNTFKIFGSDLDDSTGMIFGAYSDLAPEEAVDTLLTQLQLNSRDSGIVKFVNATGTKSFEYHIESFEGNKLQELDNVTFNTRGIFVNKVGADPIGPGEPYSATFYVTTNANSGNIISSVLHRDLAPKLIVVPNKNLSISTAWEFAFRAKKADSTLFIEAKIYGVGLNNYAGYMWQLFYQDGSNFVPIGQPANTSLVGYALGFNYSTLIGEAVFNVEHKPGTTDNITYRLGLFTNGGNYFNNSLQYWNATAVALYNDLNSNQKVAISNSGGNGSSVGNAFLMNYKSVTDNIIMPSTMLITEVID